MMIFALLTLMLITNDSAVGQTVNLTEIGFIGQNVLLPCPCPTETTILGWQRGEILLNAYPKEKNKNIDKEYKSRTELFNITEKKNCSLLLRNVSLEDAAVYTCYALNEVNGRIRINTNFNINLTVLQSTNSPSKQINSPAPVPVVSVGVPILVVAAIMTAGLLTILLIRRRQRRNMDTDKPAQQPMMSV